MASLPRGNFQPPTAFQLLPSSCLPFGGAAFLPSGTACLGLLPACALFALDDATWPFGLLLCTIFWAPLLQRPLRPCALRIAWYHPLPAAALQLQSATSRFKPEPHVYSTLLRYSRDAVLFPGISTRFSCGDGATALFETPAVPIFACHSSVPSPCGLTSFDGRS